MLMTFGIVVGSVSIALIGADAAFDLCGKARERKILREENRRLANENMELRNRNELLTAQKAAKQCTLDLIKDIQIDDLKQEVRDLEARLAAKDQLLKQKWGDSCERVNTR